MKLAIALVFFCAPLAHAQALNLGSLGGSQRQEYPSPSGFNEICIVPKHWPGGGYYRTKDVENEASLCSYDFYSNIGICPKYNSSNPAILLLKPNEKYSKAAIDNSSCNVKAMNIKTEAKFKQSTSCSYTPSILAYYQLSRLLGDVGRVPVSVIRTMDLRTHSALTQKANNRLRGSRSDIAQTWSEFLQVHRRPDLYPDIVDASLSQIFGALSDNPKNEELYTEVSGIGAYETRYPRFLKQRPFLRVANPKSVSEILGTAEFTKVAQSVTQMKDVSDMVLLDTLLNQQDRIGNIHYKFYWYAFSLNNPGQIEKIKTDAKWSNGQVVIPKSEKEAMTGRTAVLVKEMLLKDNDCGVKKDNMMRKVGALEKVRHLSYLTYFQFMKFNESLSSSATKDYFMTELLFSRADFESLQDNSAKARDILKSNCRAGRLRFDVDLVDYVSGNPIIQRSCEI